jgi:methionine aminopeptidase
MPNFPGQGPLNLVPDTETRLYKANGAIAKGDVVGLLVGTSATGYTIDQATATTIAPIGVAAETVADGDWCEVVVGGFCNFVTNNGTDIVAGDYLSVAAGVAVPLEMSEVTLTNGWPLIFGQALDAETGTTLTEAFIYKRVP